MIKGVDQVRLLPRDAVVRTSNVDQGDWNYHFLLGPIQRKRFEIVAGLLPEKKSGRLLEIGYGSGIFMPELSRRCDELYGLDPHPKKDEINAALRRHCVDASLTMGNAESIPFDESFFDVVVAVSAMEYVSDIERSCVEIGRVLAPGGIFVFITPGQSRILDLAVWLLTGQSAEFQYGDRRQRLSDVVFRFFDVAQQRVYCPFSLPVIKLYTAYDLRPKGRA